MRTKALRRSRIICILIAMFALTSCDLIGDIVRALGTSTIFYYTPITFCASLFDAEGNGTVDGEPVLVENVFVYRLDSIQNNQASEVALYPGYFYLRLSDTRLATLAAQRLTTIPSPIRVNPGERIESPGLVAMRFGGRDLIEPVSGTGECGIGGIDLCYRVTFLPLQYDPALRGEARPYVGINSHGVRTRIVDPRPCRLDEVLSLAARTR